MTIKPVILINKSFIHTLLFCTYRVQIALLNRVIYIYKWSDDTSVKWLLSLLMLMMMLLLCSRYGHHHCCRVVTTCRYHNVFRLHEALGKSPLAQKPVLCSSALPPPSQPRHCVPYMSSSPPSGCIRSALSIRPHYAFEPMHVQFSSVVQST